MFPTSGEALSARSTSLKPRAAGWPFSTTIRTAGSTFFSPMAIACPAKNPIPIIKTPTQHLFKNNRDGTFTDVTERSGLARTGWGTGVCVGDYDNDGWDDLFCCYWGHNVLWHNNGDGTFTDVTKKAGLWEDRVRWGSGCTWLDYDRDGFLDLFVCNYIDLDLQKVPVPGQTGYCQWKGIPVMCGPRGLPGGMNILYHNNGNGTFTDVSEKAGILKPGPRYSITAVSYDFDNDGWPDIYVAVDSEPSILFHNKHDGTFEDIAVMAGCAYNEDGQEQAGMGVGVADYDGDGWLDIFKTNFSDDTPDLYHNNGDGTFTDVTFVAGLGVNTQYVCWGAGLHGLRQRRLDGHLPGQRPRLPGNRGVPPGRAIRFPAARLSQPRQRQI